MMLVWFLVMLGSLFLIIPGLIVFFWWLMADKVVVLEGLRGRDALRRSRDLMRFGVGPGFLERPWIRVSILMGAAFLVGLGMYVVLLIPAWLLGLVIPDQIASLLAEGLQLVAETLATAYGSIALVIYYYDIRVRKEDFDHRAMAEQIREQPDGSAVTEGSQHQIHHLLQGLYEM